MTQHGMSGRSAERKPSPLFELAFALVRFDHVARFIVNANHGVVRTAVKLFYCLTITDVPSGLASKKCSAIPLGKRMQPCDAA